MSGIDRQNRLRASSNGSKHTKRTDRRPRRTRNTLGEALALLIQEKPFDEITVQQVLDRAGVGRTTFYTHFTDKEDLFFSDVEQFLEMMGNLLNRQKAPPQRLAPLEELLEHLAGESKFYKALVTAGKFDKYTNSALVFLPVPSSSDSHQQELKAAQPNYVPLPEH